MPRSLVFVSLFIFVQSTCAAIEQVTASDKPAAEAREGLALLRALVPPTPTGALDLHDVALDIGMAVNHSTYDTLYLAFAIAMDARGVVVADGPFVRDMARHPDPVLAGMLIPLSEWGRGRSLLPYRAAN